MQMMHGNGFGFNCQGLYVNGLMDFHPNWRRRADEISDTLKNTTMLGQYMLNKHQGRYYAKARTWSVACVPPMTPCSRTMT